MRTLEMFRSAGIEEQVRRQSLKEFAPEGAIVLMDSLAGKQLAGLIPSLNEGVDALSPCRRLFVTFHRQQRAEWFKDRPAATVNP